MPFLFLATAFPNQQPLDFVILLVIFVGLAILILAAAAFVLSLRRRSPEREHRRIRIPAMQETLKSQKREKSDTTSSDEAAAVIAAAIAVCTADAPEQRFRVVSFRRLS